MTSNILNNSFTVPPPPAPFKITTLDLHINKISKTYTWDYTLLQFAIPWKNIQSVNVMSHVTRREILFVEFSTNVDYVLYDPRYDENYISKKILRAFKPDISNIVIPVKIADYKLYLVIN